MKRRRDSLIKHGAIQKVSLSLVALLAALLTTVALQSHAQAIEPLAARLLAEPYESTGIRVNISNLGSVMRGLTTDGTTVYAMNTSGNIVSVPLSSVDRTEGQPQQDIAGTLHTVGWGQDGAPSIPNLGKLSLSYSHGCIFITNDSNTEGAIKLYCIDVSDYSVTEIAVPGDKPLPEGFYWVESSMIDFPDGRIGKVSKYIKLSGDYNYESTLRTYTVSGTGKNVSIAFSEDYSMSDTGTVYNDGAGWARDEHGIATDGTYLYRIQWNSVEPNTKVWALESGTPASVAFEGSYTMPYGNMHYLAHNHIENNYLVGHFDGSQFFITTAADPGPGPGNPLTPTFGTVTPTADGYSVQITNYDPAFIWDGEATLGGTVHISETGLMTVTGLDPSTLSTVTVGTSRTGFPNGTADVSGTSLPIETGPDNDKNGDEIVDSEQPNVEVITSPITGKTVVLVADEGCEIEESLIKAESTHIAQDPQYDYPAGLLNFTIDCGTPGYRTTIKQYYYDTDPSGLVLRKYNPTSQTYFNITNEEIAEVNIYGEQVLVAAYSITDGGELDINGEEDGIIIDPAGLGQAVAASDTPGDAGYLAVTGHNLLSVVTLGTLLIGLGCALSRKKSRRLMHLD